MEDYKRVKVHEPETREEMLMNTLGAVGFILFVGALFFLKELLLCASQLAG